MKKLLFLFLSAIFAVAAANAQDAVHNGIVTLKNGTVIEGSIQKSGNDVIVTNVSGDVFYFTQSEILNISTGEEKKTKNKSEKNQKNQTVYNDSPMTTKENLSAYKRDIKMAHYEAGTYGYDINEFWKGNDQARHYFKKHNRLNNAAWITGAAGFTLVSTGVLLTGDLISISIGGAAMITAAFLPIAARKNLKRSYECHTRYGQNYTVNVSTTPVFYAQGGAGIGIAMNF